MAERQRGETEERLRCLGGDDEERQSGGYDEERQSGGDGVTIRF